MITVALSYSLDGSHIADLIRTNFKENTSFKLDDYPIPGRNGNPEFWRSLNFGLLSADVLLFVCTEGFILENKDLLIEIERNNKKKYRTALIIPEECASIENKISSDIIFKVEQTQMWLSKLEDYFKVIDRVKQNGKAFKKARMVRFKQYTTRISSLIIAYLAIIITALAVFLNSESVWGKSSAELILLLTALLAVFSVAVILYNTLSRMQRNIEREEQDEFGNDLDVSLSGGTQTVSIQSNIASAMMQSLVSSSTITHDILDIAFSLMKASKVEQESVNGPQNVKEEVDTAQAIGDNEYLPLGHLKLNWKQMKGYYDISKKQATTSFRWAIFICFLGIAIIAFAILSPLIPVFSSHNSLIPVIGAIAGAIVELFAGTILIVYIKSLSQMNLYHTALSDYQRYLSCVNLVSLIKDNDAQSQLYKEIIMTEMKKTVREENDDIKKSE